jgi:hypothetical protein
MASIGPGRISEKTASQSDTEAAEQDGVGAWRRRTCWLRTGTR